ncbi:MAG: hypothetical protein J6K73_05380 [Clostridia bacterium]|nr:hypothetical protein [Clostridia bacterium]
MAHDWGKIETDYMVNDLSYRQIAEKYSISESTVARHGKKNDWPEKRQQFASKVHTRALQKIASRRAGKEAKALSRVEELAERLVEKLEEAMQDEKQLYRHILTTSSRAQAEKVLDKMDTKAVRDIAATMQTLTDTLRTIGGLMTARDEFAVEIEAAKLELEREKIAKGAEDDGESGVVILGGLDYGPVQEVVLGGEEEQGNE